MEKNRTEYVLFFNHFLHDYALMNSFYITCTLAAVQRKRGTSIYSLKKPTAPPTSPKKEVD
jgi:hypothetical protein